MSPEIKQFDVEEPKVAPQDNTVIPTDPKPGDYMSEGDTGIAYEVNQASGDYTEYEFPDSDGDYQHSVFFDTCACTNYGCGHSCEIQLNRFLSLGLFSPDEIARLTKVGFIVNGKFTRLSKRYNAIKSGTKWGVGNYLYKPWDSARHDGMVPEALCPYINVRLQRSPVFTQDDYYNSAAAETPECKEAASVWLDIIEAKYEIVSTDQSSLQKHMKQAPLCIASKVCPPWDGSIIPSCGLGNGHCTLLHGPQEPILYKDLDSYQPADKRLAWDYGINYAIKGVLYIKRLLPSPLPTPHASFHWTNSMTFGNTSNDIKNLQEFLKIQGFFPTNVPTTGYFGLVTAGAVLKFQLQNKIASPVQLKAWAGHHVGPLTLPVLNKLAA